MLDINNNYTEDATIIINHPNKIIFKCDVAGVYSLSSNASITIFDVINSRIEIKDCYFDISSGYVFNLTSGNNDITLVDCSGKFNYLCTNTNTIYGYNHGNKMVIKSSIFNPETTTEFRNFKYLSFEDVEIDGNNLYNNNTPFFKFINCDINYFNVNVSNPMQEITSIFSFYNSNIKKLNITLNDHYSEHSNFEQSIYYFDTCNINEMTIDMGIYSQSVIGFMSCIVNELYYINNFTFDQGESIEGQLIEGRGGSRIYISNMYRESYKDDFNHSYFIKANNGSFITVDSISNYGMGSIVTKPNYIIPNGTYVFGDFNTGGSCIYINVIEDEGGEGGESGSGSGESGSGSGESGSGSGESGSGE